jgi:hypothetical protein
MLLDAASCAALLEKSRYDVAILPQLEEYCSSAVYDLEAGLACLKLYQFNPDSTKVAIVAKILLKTLTRLPQTDYLACSYIVPDRVVRPAAHPSCRAASLPSLPSLAC